MEKNQIKVKNLKNDYVTFFTIKGNEVYNRHGKRMYCSCTGNTEETATAMMYNDEEGVYCPHCHEKKVEILQSYEEWKQEQEEKQKEQLENIHIVEVGSDWECGFKFYGLSARIDYDSWGKIKHLFRYYRRGWSRGQELEWYYGEPSGWLTQNPDEVEKILIEMGIMKEENTMEQIQKRQQVEKERKQKENEQKQKERKFIINKMDEIQEKINEAFDIPEKRELSDAEANEHYFNADFFKNTVCTYRIFNKEIIMCRNMGDFKYGLAIPYKQWVKDLLDSLSYYNRQIGK